MTTRADLEKYAEDYEIELLFADGFDNAIVGLVTRFGFESPVVLYDRARMVQILVQRDGLSMDDADEHISFNVEGAWMGEQTPAFLLRPSL